MGFTLEDADANAGLMVFDRVVDMLSDGGQLGIFGDELVVEALGAIADFDADGVGVDADFDDVGPGVESGIGGCLVGGRGGRRG
jgi:hypothetical protein